MSSLEAVLLGLVQGAAQWLPIGGTAHLWESARTAGLARPRRGVHCHRSVGDGPIGSRLLQKGHRWSLRFWRSTTAADRRLLLPIAVGTMPIIVCGVLLQRSIEHEWPSLYVVAGSVVGLPCF